MTLNLFDNITMLTVGPGPLTLLTHCTATTKKHPYAFDFNGNGRLETYAHEARYNTLTHSTCRDKRCNDHHAWQNVRETPLCSRRMAYIYRLAMLACALLCGSWFIHAQTMRREFYWESACVMIVRAIDDRPTGKQQQNNALRITQTTIFLLC